MIGETASTKKLTAFSLTSAMAGWTLLGVVLLGIVFVGWLLGTPEPRPMNAPAAEFSAQRTLQILERIMDEGTPHPIGTTANAVVRARVIAELESLGLAPDIQSRFVCADYRHYCGTVHNVLARIPGRGRSAVVLNAHYDTQPATPGAADAMAGVASNLEIARILLDGGPLERDVILLFNDGEEAGLLGATAFVEHHPWAADVVGFVNLEARGSGGPSTPVYTIGADRAVLGPYASGVGRRAPGSAVSAVTALLPAANDIVVFDRLRIPGVTLGFASNIRHYHTPLDDLAHLDAGSVQQQGESALRITRALADSQAGPGDGGRLTFVALGPVTPRWPEAWTPALAYLAAGVFLILGVLLTRAGVATGRQLAWGLVAWPVTVIVAFLGCAVVNFVRKELTESPAIWISRPDPTFFGFWAAAALLVALATWAFRRGAAPWGLWLGCWLWWAASGAILSAFMPGLGYLFLVPTLAATVAAGALLLRPGPPISLAATGLPALLALVVWLSHAWFLKDLIGLGNMPPVATLVAIGLTGSAPLFAAMSHRRAVVGGLAVGAVLLLGIGTRIPVFSANAPQWANLVYSLDADSGRARWLYTGYPVPAGVTDVGGFRDESDRALPWTPRDAGSATDAPIADLAPPVVEVLESLSTDGRRKVRVRLRSLRGAPVIQLAVEAARGPEEVSFADVIVPEDRATFSLFDDDFVVYTVWNAPDSGVVANLVFRGEEPFEFQIADRSYDLPDVAAALLAARPAWAVPNGQGDATIIRRRVQVP